MDSKGLDVCNSLERDKACWRVCCRDGRKEVCHDGLDSLTVGLLALRAPARFIATKPDEEAQTGPAEYLATSAIMSKGHYSFEAQRLLPCLTTLTAASADQADQSMLDQSSPNIIAPNHLWSYWAKAPLPQLLCIFKICRGCTYCRGGLSECNQVLVSVSAAPPNLWPDLDKENGMAST